MSRTRLTWCERGAVILPMCFTACFSETVFRREMRRLKVPVHAQPPFVKGGSNATTHFLERSDGSLAAIVCMDPDDEIDGIQIAALLVHEAVHIWQECMKVIGEEKPSAEFEAYGIQGISQQLMYLYAEGKNR